MGSKYRAITLLTASFLCACGARAVPPLTHEDALVARLDTVPLVEKPGPGGKVRGLAHLADVFSPSVERATDTVVVESKTEGYAAASGLFIGIRRERSGPLFLGPEGSFARTTVATTDALCAVLGAPPAPPPPADCAAAMRRLALPDARTLGYLPCLAPACPLVIGTHLAGGGVPFKTTVDGLGSVRGLATPGGFRLVLQTTVLRTGQSPGTRYEIRDIGPGLPVRSTIEGSFTTAQPDGSLLVRLVQVRFEETGARIVGTERRAPNAGAVGETKPLDERVAYPP